MASEASDNSFPSINQPSGRKDASQPTGQSYLPDGPACRWQAGRGRQADRDEFDKALAELSNSIAARKVEPICTSYLRMRTLARGMKLEEMFNRIKQASGDEALDAIISAFSHRRCFMCDGGVIPCQACQGRGSTDGVPCLSCDGQGVEVCSFCLGTGWTDYNQIPKELRRAVLLRRFKHVEKDLARLARTVSGKSLDLVNQLSEDQKKEIIVWLIKLQARLRELAELGKGKDRRADKFGIAAGQIERILKRLRSS